MAAAVRLLVGLEDCTASAGRSSSLRRDKHHSTTRSTRVRRLIRGCKMGVGVTTFPGCLQARWRLEEVGTDQAACGRAAGARCGAQTGPPCTRKSSSARWVQDGCKMHETLA